MTRPLARSLILTDSGSVDFTEAMAAYTAPIVVTPAPTMSNTLATSHILIASLPGASAAFAARRTAIANLSARLTALGAPTNV